MGRSLTWTLVVPALAAAACNAVFGVDELRFDPGAEASGASDGSGAGGSGGSGGGSTTNSGPGGAGGCDPALCPGIDTACRSRACTDDVCGFVDAAEGTACSGGVCDGQGSCVACLTEDDCDAADLCVEGTCVPPHCSDGELSGDESDVDCGGSCLLCPAMSDSGGDDDCLGNICLFGNCHACGLIGNGELSGCQPDHYCVEGTCVVRKLDGDLCKDDDEYLNDECTDDNGTYCDASCERT